MNNILDYNNIIKRRLAKNKDTLFSIYQASNNNFNMIDKNFGNNLITNIAQKDGCRIRNFFGCSLLGIYGTKLLPQELGILAISKEFIEFTIIPIWARTFISRKKLNNILLCDISNNNSSQLRKES